ncbi:MAG TPA: SDR family NAD(P)-dependent oxidoreductase [Thermoleophilia bacterium]|nr:SDR family NAD(P)-dependent oxidoreductase [Thermoleophilia bacterium]
MTNQAEQDQTGLDQTLFERAEKKRARVRSGAAASDTRPVAVITGASRGLGLELARALALDGWNLVITARGAADLDRAAAELGRITAVAALAGSVVDDDHRAELAHAASELGGADLLVNNASTLAGFELDGAATPALEEPDVRVWAVDPGDMRTRMHEEAAPGEDISDLPLPGAVVPAFRALLRDWPQSGRYVASQLLEASARTVGAR